MRKLDLDGWSNEIKSKKHYLSPSQKKREKHKKALVRFKKEEAKRNARLEKSENYKNTKPKKFKNFVDKTTKK